MNRFKLVSAAAAVAAVAFLAVATTALERANAQTLQKLPPGGGAIVRLQCVQGFSQGQGGANDNSMRWECKTPIIVCPPRQGWTRAGNGGPLPPEELRSGFRLRYHCSYTK